MSDESDLESRMDLNLEEEKLFDIVILLGPNDLNQINRQLEYNKKNIIGYRNIYIIPYDPNIQFEGCITIPETMFPFNIWSVYNFHGKTNRGSWYLQQLLKLYAGVVIPDIMERYLVIDSDTIFLKPTTFIQDGLCLLNYSDEFWGEYFLFMERLHPSFRKMHEKSGVCHHMMFETKYVKEMIEMVEKHNDNHYFYDIFLYKVNPNFFHFSGASEYELYFNYMLNYHSDKFIMRKLLFINTGDFNDNTNYYNDLNLDYVSVHWHINANKPK